MGGAYEGRSGTDESMSEEPPGGWELKRDVTQMRSDLKDGFASLNVRLDDMAKSMVSSREHANDMARMGERHAELVLDIAEERAARKEAITAETKAREKTQAAQEAAQQRTGVWLRWVATGLLVPTLVPLLLHVMNRGA